MLRERQALALSAIALLIRSPAIADGETLAEINLGARQSGLPYAINDQQFVVLLWEPQVTQENSLPLPLTTGNADLAKGALPLWYSSLSEPNVSGVA